MSHGPSSDWGKDKAIGVKTKIGIILFFVYFPIYITFILINTLYPKLMGVDVMLGQNLAVIYGLGLIILAVIMGFVYNIICSNAEDKMNKE